MADRSAPQAASEYADAAHRYRLDGRIAAGGIGEVWRATDTVLDRPVAVKLLRQEHADEPVFRSRFEIEAQHAAGLHHPGVAQVFDFGAGDDADGGHPPYLVMELVEGQPLSALLRPGEGMEPNAAVELLAGVADALGAAHARGIVHRDVKPANVLVLPDRRVKITDFGIARAVDAVALTRPGEVLGTPQYLSPEQAEGRPATPASDVYALGAVAFECLAGRRPYVADTPLGTAIAHLREPVPDLPTSVPPALAAVVRRALAKDPAERCPDGTAFAAALRASVATPPAEVVAPATTQVLTAPVPRAAGAAAVGPGAAHAAVWRERASRVPVAVWVAAATFVLVVAVAAVAGVGSGGAATTPNGRPSGPTPAAAHGTGRATTTPTTSPATTAATTPATTAPVAPPKPAKPGKGHGPGHGHHGKGHQ